VIRLISIYCFLATSLMFVRPACAERTVVLVVSSDSPIVELSVLDIRKAYLGLPVTLGDGRVRAIRMNGDEQLTQIFFQSIIAMSSKSYRRRLLSLTLKFGTPRPMAVNGQIALLNTIALLPYGITYMWMSDAEADTRVRIIKVLWQES
jgi:hypothetical protein